MYNATSAEEFYYEFLKNLLLYFATAKIQYLLMRYQKYEVSSEYSKKGFDKNIKI